MQLIYHQKSYSIQAFSEMTTEEEWLLDIIDFLKFWLSSAAATIPVYTSGSTGRPKSIAITKQAMKQSAAITNRYFGLSSGKTAMLSLPVRYIAGKMMLARAIEANMNLLIENPSSLPLSTLDNKIDFIAMTPFQMENVCSNYPEKLDLINVILLGGAPVSKKLSEKLQHVPSHCYQSYGMTETITHIALHAINGKNKTDHFQVLDAFQISLDDRGCLVIEADHILDKKVTTNDLVEILDARTFRWLGRYDNVINTGGIKIYPEIVESKLQDLIQAPFFITGTEDDKLGQQVTLCLEMPKLEITDREHLLKKIKSRLSKFEFPRSILFFDCFLYTETGKIRRQRTLATCL